MADIQLRFNKDMLVLSSPINSALDRLEMTSEADKAYTLLFEPEVLEELYKVEAIAGAQCIVADTAMLTPARLAKVGMEKDAQAMAANAMQLASAMKPQHILVEIAPCELPLDVSSKSSLVENRDQYARAAQLFNNFEFDAFFVNGFSRVADLKCALMGIRKVSDKPIFASVTVDCDGVLVKKLAAGLAASSAATANPVRTLGETIEDAASVMCEFGADVAGFSAAVSTDAAIRLSDRVRAACDLPMLVQLEVVSRSTDQDDDLDQTGQSESFEQDNGLESGQSAARDPYFDPDTMVDAADALRGAGVQFLRAVGDATPAYTGALVAATDRLDVVLDTVASSESVADKTDLDTLAETLRARVSAAMGKRDDQ